MLRVVQNTAETIIHDFGDESPAATVADVVVRIDSDDGTPLVPTTTLPGPLDITQPTRFGYVLTPDHTALLDRLTVTWTAAVDGITQTAVDTVEIVGGILFSNAELRAALGVTSFDAQRINEARAYAESELERALRYALVPRYDRFTFSGDGTTTLLLPPYTRAIREVIGDVSASLSYDGGRILTNPAGWPRGMNNIVGRIEYGMDPGNSLLPGAKRQALSLAVEYLGGGTGTVDPRAERVITDDGTIVYGSSTAGEFRAPGVNEWVAANRLPVFA